jgi:hypothetical protein
MICKIIKDFPNFQEWKVGDLIRIKEPSILLERKLVVPMAIVETTIVDAEIIPEAIKKIESKTKKKGGTKKDATSKDTKKI